ncbi:MAG TPA: VacJ family lipoprotein [Nitrospira sp.]|nr:VacJ family lipoprotein [Nitrospira sp.]
MKVAYGRWVGLLAFGVMVLVGLSACGEQVGAVRQGLAGEMSARPIAGLSNDASASAVVMAAAAKPAPPAPARSTEVPDESASSDEPFDPFAKADEATGEEYDPWEPLNTRVFEFNRQVDRFLLKPVAKGYNMIVPDLVQVGISNMFYNIRVVPRLFNNVFQGKMKGAGIEIGRFLINSTVGLAGFLDVAKEVNLVTPEEDLGQTLGWYGVKPGPYVVLPFLPPFTVRDLVGYVGDIALNPVNWLVAPIIEVNGVPSLIAHKNRTTTSFVQIGARVGEIVNERSRNLEKFQGVEEATLDLYSAVRNAYLQTRAKAVRE